MLVTLITCTGHRPEALALSQKYLQEQYYGGAIEWIIVDDSLTTQGPIGGVTSGNITKKLIKGPVLWREGINTQRSNMEAALKHVTGDYIAVWEDDDYYKPEFLSNALYFLQRAELYGEGNARYYNLGLPGFKEMHNILHSSLCQTVFRKSSLHFLESAVNSGELFFDVHLWRAAREKRIPCVMLNESNVIGIKGMPGRGNIGAGGKTKDFMYDPQLKILNKWCGEEASNYLPFIKGHENDRRKSDIRSANTISSPFGHISKDSKSI